jgi:hypothetical protein
MNAPLRSLFRQLVHTRSGCWIPLSVGAEKKTRRGRVFSRDGRIRTGDPSLPKRVLYRAEPRPEGT